MAMRAFHITKDGTKTEVTEIVTQVQISGDYRSCSRSCAFGIVHGNYDERTWKIQMEVGDIFKVIDVVLDFLHFLFDLFTFVLEIIYRCCSCYCCQCSNENGAGHNNSQNDRNNSYMFFLHFKPLCVACLYLQIILDSS